MPKTMNMNLFEPTLAVGSPIRVSGTNIWIEPFKNADGNVSFTVYKGDPDDENAPCRDVFLNWETYGGSVA